MWLGQPGAPPLLLVHGGVHGGRDHCRNWNWVAEALRDECHVVSPDLRGHRRLRLVGLRPLYPMTSYMYDLERHCQVN